MEEDLISILNGLVHSTTAVKSNSVILIQKVLNNLEESLFDSEKEFENKFSVFLTLLLFPLKSILPNLHNPPSSSSPSPPSNSSKEGGVCVSEKEGEVVKRVMQTIGGIVWKNSSLLLQHSPFLLHVVANCALQLTCTSPSLTSELQLNAFRAVSSIAKASEKMKEELSNNEKWKQIILASLVSFSSMLNQHSSLPHDFSPILLSFFLFSSLSDLFLHSPQQLSHRDFLLANLLKNFLRSPNLKVTFSEPFF